MLITGASGFLGRFVVKALSRQGIETIIAGRRRPQGVAAEDFLQIDFLGSPDYTNLVESSNATHLIHLAWYTEHAKYWTSPLNLRWVEATVRLTEAFCISGGQKVVLAGSCAEYDWSFGYCNETKTPLKPGTLYGVAKDATRSLVVSLCAERQVPCAWGRVFYPYGPGEDSRRLIPSLMEVYEGKRAPFGVNAMAYRDFLHIEDAANAFLTLLQTEASGVFNICSAQPVQIAEIIKIVARSHHGDPNQVLALATERPGEPPLLVGDNLRLKSLGWRAQHDLAEYLGQ
ncbi:MAG: NAD(P)-dependent oxidoreductase [Sterolibacterium sp.]